MNIDRDFVFGLLALQNGFIDEEQLVDAVENRSHQNDENIRSQLERNNSISTEERTLLYELTEAHLRRGDGNTLAQSFPIPPPLKSRLSNLNDATVNKSLSLFADETIDSPLANSDGITNLQNDQRFNPIREHARGGLGQVSVAHDGQLNRKVALKQIRPKYVTDDDCQRRFVLEAQVTGSLEHPGIVPVYGLGQNDDGQPYYAMRFIEGDSLREAINQLHQGNPVEIQSSLELRRLLSRFITVCNTLEYAHSRGVLHRDIKPDNIMLGPYGETLVVDWGLAKVTEESTLADTLVDGLDSEPKPDDNESTSNIPKSGSGGSKTRLGAAMGTPGYMSPEQSLGWHDTLTPASDVYSLGATLYALVTGETAFTGDVDTMLKATQVGEFPRPREKNPLISKPLEAIILRAMETKATERYSSVADMANDIEAYLAGASVSAWEEPLSVRIGRWVRKHRVAVNTVLSGLLVSLVSLVIGVVLLSAANQRESTARETAETERDRANDIFRLSMAANGDYLKEITNSPRLKAASLQPLRRDLLQNARTFYAKLADISGQSPLLKREQADAYFRLANIEDELDNRDEANDHYKQAIKLVASIPAKDLGTDDTILACRSRVNLATNLWTVGQRDAATKELETCEKSLNQILKATPNSQDANIELMSILHNRATWQFDDGEYEHAEQNYLAAKKRRANIDTVPEELVEIVGGLDATLESSLGTLYLTTSQLDKSKTHFQAAAGAYQVLSEKFPHDAFFENEFARNTRKLADVYQTAGEFESAIEQYDAAIKRHKQLIARHPDISKFKYDTGSALMNYSMLVGNRGEVDQSIKLNTESVEIFRQLHSTRETDGNYASALAGALYNLSQNLDYSQRTEEAVDPCDEMLELRKQFVEKHPDSNKYQLDFASALLLKGRLETNLAKLDSAIQYHRQATQALETLIASEPDSPNYLDTLGHCLSGLASLLGARNDPQATETYERAYRVRQKLAKQVSDIPRFELNMLASHSNYARHLGDKNRLTDSAKEFKLCIEESTKLYNQYPEDEQIQTLIGNAHSGLADTLYRQKQFAQAVENYDSAFQYQEPAEHRWDLELGYAQALACAGNVDKAASIALALDKPENDWLVNHELAITFGFLAQQAGGDKSKEYQNRSFELLSKLVGESSFMISEAYERFDRARVNGAFEGFEKIKPLIESIEKQREEGIKQGY